MESGHLSEFLNNSDQKKTDGFGILLPSASLTKFWLKKLTNTKAIPVRIPIKKAKCFQDFLWQRNYSVDFAYLQYIPSPYGTYIGYKKGCLPLSNLKTHLGAATKTEEIEIDWI